VDPYAYLRDVITRMPSMAASELGTLLPDRWIEDHPEHRIQERVDEAVQRAERKRRRRAERRHASTYVVPGGVSRDLSLRGEDFL